MVMHAELELIRLHDSERRSEIGYTRTKRFGRCCRRQGGTDPIGENRRFNSVDDEILPTGHSVLCCCRHNIVS